jgi:hypothetical protein
MICTVFESAKQAIETVLRDNNVVLANHDLGEEKLAPSMAYPGVVWVPMGGPVTAAKQLGADSAMRRAAGKQATGVREMAQRNVSIRVHVWDTDFTATETLMGHYVAALRQALTAHSFEVTHEAWGIGPSPTTKEPVQNLKSGSLCILTIEIRMPFTFEKNTLSAPPHHPTIVPTIPAAA